MTKRTKAQLIAVGLPLLAAVLIPIVIFAKRSLPPELARLIPSPSPVPIVVMAEGQTERAQTARSNPFLLEPDLIDECHRLLIQNDGTGSASTVSVTISSQYPMLSLKGFGDVEFRNENGMFVSVGERATYLPTSTFQVFVRINTLNPEQSVWIEYLIRRPLQTNPTWPSVFAGYEGGSVSRRTTRQAGWLSREQW